MKRWQKIFVAIAAMASVHHVTIIGILSPDAYVILMSLILGAFGYTNMKEKKLTKE